MGKDPLGQVRDARLVEIEFQAQGELPWPRSPA